MHNFIISGFSDEIDPDIIKQFEHLNTLGIKYFEPRGINGKNIADLSESESDELLATMQKYGIKASSIGSPIGKIKITDDFEPHMEKFKNVVAIAKKLDCKYIRMFSFFMPQGEDPAIYRDEVIARLKKLKAYAKEQNVVLLHENEKDIYGDVASRCADILNELYDDNFKAVFDPANFVQCGEDTKNAWNLMCKYIEYMHIKDALTDGTVVPAGFGEGNVPFILGELAQKNYNGFLSLEPHLGSFDGLSDLEIDDEMLKLEKSDASKYTIAFDALNKIIKEIK